MTHHPIKVLEDGTRVYSNGTKYKPMADRDRTNQRRKPPESDAVPWHGVWFHPLVLLPGDQRLWPETVPDEEAYAHAWKARKCKCLVCKRPAAYKWRRRAFAQMRKDESSTT